MSSDTFTPEPLTYTAEQLAKRMQISVRTIREQRARGLFPFAPIPGLGKAVRFSRLEVEAELTRTDGLRLAARSRRMRGAG